MVKRNKKGQLQKGSVLNPAGRPKMENSWANIIRTTMEMTAEELSDSMGGQSNELGQAIAKFPRGIPIKRLLAARLITALMFEPTPGLVNALMDREEGKVADKLDLSVRPTLKIKHDRP